MGSSLSPLVFTGISKFSGDFQTILSRAVSIASVPLKQMQNEQIDALARKQLLSDLGGSVSTLAERIAALGKIGETKAIRASSSDSSKVSVSATGATNPVTYTISDVVSLAKAASETSVTGYATADNTTVSTTGKLDLVLGETTYHLDLGTRNDLAGLRDAINTSGADVTVTILTTGTGENPNYLSISANTAGQTTLSLIDDPAGTAANLLTAANQGANTVFKLNGVDVIKKNTFMNDVVPGMTFTILKTTEAGEKITLSLASDRSQLSNGLGSLVSAYNDAVGKVDAQIGKAAGLLAGDMVVRQTQHALRALTGFESTGSIRTLAELGIELDKNGRMSLDQAVFDALTDQQIDEAFKFLGSASTGFRAIAQRFTQISDPVTGLIKLQQDQYDKTDLRLSGEIAELTDRISAMQAGLSLKLQAADALLARLESQQSMLDANIQSLNLALYGRKDG